MIRIKTVETNSAKYCKISRFDHNVHEKIHHFSKFLSAYGASVKNNLFLG